MSRGPARTPTHILNQRGSWRGKERAEGEPTPPEGEPDRPEWLGDEATQVWEQLTAQLEQVGTLHTTDANAIARYCVFWVWWRRCVLHVEQYGRTYPKYCRYRDGNVVRVEKDGELRPVVERFVEHPEVSLTVALGKELLLLEREFGLTPAARARIQVRPKDKPADGKSKFFSPYRTVG